MSDIVIYISAFIVIVVIGVFLSGLHILREWERAPVLTLGRFMGIKGPGLIYVFPFISKIPIKISTRLQVYSFVTEQTLTKDNVPVDVDAIMYFMPTDVQKSVLSVENYRTATEYAAQTTLREVVGQTIFDELLAEREKIGTISRGIIDEKTESWGIKVTAVEVRDVRIPPSLQEAMSRQAQAERERRARVTLALAESQAAEKMIQAADQYKNNELAFQLRWMNMLYELGLRANSSLIMIPSNIPTAGLSPLGLFDVKDLMPKADKKKGTDGEQQQQ